MANLLILGQRCQNPVGLVGKAEIFWCATGVTGDQLTETTIEGSTVVDFLASDTQMSLQVQEDARTKYETATGVLVPLVGIKTGGKIV